jgi:hypothetical protein
MHFKSSTWALANSNGTRPYAGLEEAFNAVDRKSEWVIVLTLATIVISHLIGQVKQRLFGVKAPSVGYRSKFEPGWLVRLRFVRGSNSILRDAYTKVTLFCISSSNVHLFD